LDVCRGGTVPLHKRQGVRQASKEENVEHRAEGADVMGIVASTSGAEQRSVSRSGVGEAVRVCVAFHQHGERRGCIPESRRKTVDDRLAVRNN
jgi:hypothetical protein